MPFNKANMASSIEARRKAMGLTQQQLADMVGAIRVRFTVMDNTGSSGTFDCRPQLELGTKPTAWERPALTTARASSDDPPDDERPFSE